MKIRVKKFSTGEETTGELTTESDKDLVVLVLNGQVIDHWNYKASGLLARKIMRRIRKMKGALNQTVKRMLTYVLNAEDYFP